MQTYQCSAVKSRHTPYKNSRNCKALGSCTEEHVSRKSINIIGTVCMSVYKNRTWKRNKKAAHVAITSLARYSAGRMLFQVVRARDFSGMEKTGKENCR